MSFEGDRDGAAAAYLDLLKRASTATCRMFSPRGIGPFLGYLGSLGGLPVEDAVQGPRERLLEDFRRYLLEERGLAVCSVQLYERAWFACSWRSGR